MTRANYATDHVHAVPQSHPPHDDSDHERIWAALRLRQRTLMLTMYMAFTAALLALVAIVLALVAP